MIFPDPLFILIFLPATVAGFHLIARPLGAVPAMLWLLATSILFYASWNPLHLVPVLTAAVGSYGAGRLLLTIDDRHKLWRQLILAAAIAGILGLLIFYKARLSPWFTDADGSAASFSTATQILIPLGLSFVAFQLIAFLVDCLRRRFTAPKPLDFLLFLLFFPQLVMGPIVQYRELAPQFRGRRFLGFNATDLAVGLAIFAIGLAKKTILADSIAPLPTAIFADAAAGRAPGLLDAWTAAASFQFQLYFDFSGYADMAVGIARMVGIDLPLNFDKPFRAVDRFDLHRRWHISFVSFMRVHVFMPLARRLPLPLAMALTTLLSGLWHGLGWTFLVWGLLQAWLMLAGHWWRGRKGSRRLPPALAMMTTFAITASMGVMFRAIDTDAALAVYAGMIGLNGTGLDGLHRLNTGWALALLATCVIIWACPSTAEIIGRHWRAIDQRGGRAPKRPAATAPRRWQLAPTPLHAVAGGLLLLAGLLLAGQGGRFIYYQF
ncbi:MBOAT family O-acyltransferase [Tistrella sp. BH-R2-4]|uniref:Probable alginate O-acetylase AlgI n=1 Tax=Tistrella arctica TaxID=3133430 RepID=A0ABU9YNH4_9PROT